VTPSPTFPFFTEGNVISNHSLFATSLSAPTTYNVLSAVAVTLDWKESDVDIDNTLTYDVYFGNANPPVLSEIEIAASTFDASKVATTTYYWRIDINDNNSVKSIGQAIVCLAQTSTKKLFINYRLIN